MDLIPLQNVQTENGDIIKQIQISTFIEPSLLIVAVSCMYSSSSQVPAKPALTQCESFTCLERQFFITWARFNQTP